ncbi:hypothetical protein, variant 1 [Aphanomyces invadans]|uniref:EF-hand domain-containing protein n=1 Tax=Aphanomyces invadans TaxID=157072 RepID=A0A024TDW8_9STRA|nr:hypothetical protein, variant 1 [Aphanomyces invadans]ETV92340.1 hypothetical protein, variant 1 [Aphanomyces invadans]|eukprot:XP_008879091.1 hypothetical protein, variant 1 [Aphanomyces invadans]
MSQVHLICSEAAATLRELLLTAVQRGISVEDSFGHFDPIGDGVVDLTQFIQGLRTLGIPLRVEAASMLLRQLSDTSTTHLTVQDFHRLCVQLPKRQKKKGPPTSNAKRYKVSSDCAPISPAQQPSTEERVAQAQGLPEWAHDRSKRALKDLQALSKHRKQQLRQVPCDDFSDPMSDDDDEIDGESGQGSGHNGGSSTSVVAPPSSMLPPTPLPETTTDDRPQYQVFSVSDQVALRYAILTAPVDFVDATMQSSGEDQAVEHSKVSRHVRTPKSQLRLKLIIVADVFQTLDAIDAWLVSVFQVYASAKVLVIGHPSRMDSPTTVVNNATLAAWMGQLLTHLDHAREWMAQPKYGTGATPHILVGFGSGASVAAHFTLITAPQQPKLHVLNQALHALVLVNGFCCTEGIKAKIQQLLHGLQSSKHPTEYHQQLAAMLFSDSYLNRASRNQAFIDFFQHRRGFFDESTKRLWVVLLKGVLKHVDLRPVLSNLHIPLFAVHGSDNGWIPPAQVSYFQDKRQLALSFNDAMKSSGGLIHVSWLKAGHELLQERPAFFPQFLDQVVTAAHVAIQQHASPTPDDADVEISPSSGRNASAKSTDVASRLTDGSDDDELRLNQATTDGTPNTTVTPQLLPQVQELYATVGLKGIRQELIDRDIDVPLGNDDQVMWMLHQALVAEAQAARAAEAKTIARKELERQHELQLGRQEDEKRQKKLREQARQQARFQKDAMAFKAREAARLEQQAHAQAEWAERSAMEANDQYSRRREAHDAKWRDTNTNALSTVEALNEEREERQAEQAAIQQGLDRAAHRVELEANLWTLQRQMEASQVTLRGDTEGYGLDGPIRSSEIPAVVRGIQCLIEDVTAIRAQKCTSIAQQAASQAKQRAIQAALDDTNRMHSNLLRVLQRAEDEKVIAKPDAGGTVRLVPATAQGMRLLRDKLNSLHQEMANLTSVAAAATTEVAMFDRMMQSLAVLQKRTDAAMGALQTKAKAILAEANEVLAVLREEQEREAVADAKRLTAIHSTEARVQTIEIELKRVETLTTPFIDTDVYIAGAPQRVDRHILSSNLRAERGRLQESLDVLRAEAVTAKAGRMTMRAQGITLTNDLVSLLKAETMLGAVIAEDQPTQATPLGVPITNSASQPSNFPTQPPHAPPSMAVIRAKGVHDRAVDEMQWVALDRLVSPEHYLSLPEQDIEEMRRNPHYQTSLTAAHVQRLLQLPERINLALPFLKSSAEIHAHKLLRQYTKGDGEGVFNAKDVAFAPPLLIHDLDTAMRKQLGAVVRQKPLETCTPDEQAWRQCDALLNPPASPSDINVLPDQLPFGMSSVEELRHVTTLSQSDHPAWKVLHQHGSLAPPRVVVVHTLADIVAAPEHCTMLVDSNQQAKLMDVAECRLRARQSATHEFRVHTAALHLSISIVFEGKFTSVGYQVGRLAAMLYYMSGDTPTPLGQVLYSDVALNTRESLGRVVLRHQPAQVPIAQGTYHIVVGCPSDTKYSIVVNCHLVSPVGDFVKHAKQLALTYQARLPVGRQEIAAHWQSMRLAERKLNLVKDAAADAMAKAKEAEVTVASLHELLHSSGTSSEGATESSNRTHILAKIREADRIFTKQCKLHTIRLEECRDIQKALTHLASLHADLLLERARLEQALREYRDFLPDATGRVEGHTAGFKIGYALGAEYHAIKTAKMRWRDLSALKSQLRTLLTSAQRVRRKYKNDRLSLNPTERQWVLLDRIRFPDFYLWEQEAVHASDLLHESTLAPPGMELTAQEKALLTWTAPDLERVLTAPVNQLRSKELQLRKTMLVFRDTKVSAVPAALLASWRTKAPGDLKPEQREWVAVERVLHPDLYSSKLAPAIPTHWTKEKLLALIQTPEEQISILPPKERHLRDLMWHYDNAYCVEVVAPKTVPVTYHAIAHNQQGMKVEVDVDMRCRLVQQELDRAMSNPNDMMDSAILHSAPQRFPTHVLRLELEKELDRLLLAQLYEREVAEWNALAASLDIPEHDGDSSDSDPEADIARLAKAAAKQPSGAKKPKPSFQKQKRALQDALVPKTIEQEQLQLEREQLGPNGCMACKSTPCTWIPYLGDRVATIEHRVHLLQDEIERVKRSKESIVSSTMCLAAVRSGGGAVALRKMDLFAELTLECRVWEKHLRLRAIDTELHATYNWPGDHFETVALHGFTQMQQTEKVKAALTREQNSLVAHLVSYEVMEDILEYMLEGWVFGERESHRKVQGYVPSVYTHGPLTVHTLRSMASLRPDTLAADATDLKDITDAKAKFGTPFEKWTPIEVDAQAAQRRGKAVQAGTSVARCVDHDGERWVDEDRSLGSSVATVLNETEQALKFGLFCMTLMYFRGLSLLQKQKKAWNTQASHTTKDAPIKPTALQVERSKQAARQRQLDVANAKAKVGRDRKHLREQERMAAYRHKLYAQHRLAKQEAHACTQIQRVFRGFLGRGAAAKWKLRRAELEALMALEEAAATTMQRAYRGRLGRLAAEARRIELAEFIAQIRAEEAIVEEEEYWKRHMSERLRRRINGFLQRKAA